MCIIKDGETSQSPVKTKISPNTIEDVAVQTPRSPWAKLLFRQVSKQKLSRKIVPSTKVNLNKYWSKFGDLMASPTTRHSKNNLCSRLSKLTLEKDCDLRVDSKKRLSFDDEDTSHQPSIEFIPSEIQTEQTRFILFDNELNEADDNLANEIREICYSKVNECKCFHS